VQGESLTLNSLSSTSCSRFRRDTLAKNDRNGVGMCEAEAGRAIVRWCMPVLFSLLETHDVVRLLGALLGESKVRETSRA
jgi:hypothetical protein